MSETTTPSQEQGLKPFTIAESIVTHLSASTQALRLITKCDSAEDASVIVSAQKDAKGYIKRVNDARMDYTRKLDDHKKDVMKQEKDIIKETQDEVDRCSRLTSAYAKKVDEEARAQQRRIAEETRQEQLRIAEEETKARLDAEASQAWGVVPIETPSPVPTPIQVVEPIISTTVEGATTRKTATATIVAPILVPREFCQPDMKLINAHVKMLLDRGIQIENITIPGVTLEYKYNTY